MPAFQTVVYPNAVVNRLSFVSIEAAFAGVVFAGIKSLTYSDELMPADVYGTAPEKIGRTRGKANSTGSFVMYAEEFENLRGALLGGGIGYMEVPFLITITKFEPGMTPLVELLEFCRITKVENSDSEGSDALSVNVSLNIFRLTRTGGDRSTLPFPTL